MAVSYNCSVSYSFVSPVNPPPFQSTFTSPEQTPFMLTAARTGPIEAPITKHSANSQPIVATLRFGENRLIYIKGQFNRPHRQFVVCRTCDLFGGCSAVRLR